MLNELARVRVQQLRLRRVLALGGTPQLVNARMLLDGRQLDLTIGAAKAAAPTLAAALRLAVLRLATEQQRAAVTARLVAQPPHVLALDCREVEAWLEDDVVAARRVEARIAACASGSGVPRSPAIRLTTAGISSRAPVASVSSPGRGLRVVDLVVRRVRSRLFHAWYALRKTA